MTTTEQKYTTLLQEIGELLDSKNTSIMCLQYEVDDLKEKLAAAESEADAATKHACEMAVQLERMTRDMEVMQRENKLLKGA